MPNNFIDEKQSDMYFLKIAPDFSILDEAERFCVESTTTTANSVYNNDYYYFNSDTKSISTQFKRAIFRCYNTYDEDKKEVKPEISETPEFSYKCFKFDDYVIFVCISTTSSYIKFTLNNNYRVVGVVF